MLLLIQVLSMVFKAWQILLFVWVILSWVPQVPRYHPAVQALSRIIEPTLAPFRRLMPMGGIDISPILAFFVYSAALRIIEELLVRASGGF